MDEVPIQALREAIRNLFGCDSTFVESVPVVERYEGKLIWEGAVCVFDVTHPKATRAYAWSTDIPESNKRHFVAALHAGPIDSPLKAVQASILAAHKKKPGFVP